MQYLTVVSKQENDLGSFQGKPFNITVIQICAPVNKLKKVKLTSSMNTWKTY